MEWLAENWVWVLVGAVFIGMHLFGHGGHGGHGGHSGHGGGDDGGEKSDGRSPDGRGQAPGTAHRH